MEGKSKKSIFFLKIPKNWIFCIFLNGESVNSSDSKKVSTASKMMLNISGGFYNIRTFQRTPNRGHRVRRDKTTQCKLKILVNKSLSLILTYISQFYMFFWQSKMARLRFSTHAMVLKLRGWLLWSPNKALETPPCVQSDVCLNAPFLNVKIANIATFGWKYWILARSKP